VSDLLTEKGAAVSPCGRYRTRLWRLWDRRRQPLGIVMLNPSTADASLDDPTIVRCTRRALTAGYGGLEVANLFAWRATDPNELRRAADPVGPGNDAAILATAAAAGGTVVCAWGSRGRLHGRGAAVLAMLLEAGVETWALRVGSDGEPAHPLYLPYGTPLVRYPGEGRLG
jgi:hypothetical protein